MKVGFVRIQRAHFDLMLYTGAQPVKQYLGNKYCAEVDCLNFSFFLARQE